MMRGTTVAGGKRGDATWNAFAEMPCQVGGRKGHLEHFRRNSVAGGQQEKTPGTLSRGFRARWEAGKDTWNAFAGIPWQVGGGKGHLEHFCGNTVPGGRQERTPGTLSQEFRARWEAERCHLERFRGNSVPGGKQRKTPGTLSQGFRARWAAGRCHLTRFCRETVARFGKTYALIFILRMGNGLP